MLTLSWFPMRSIYLWKGKNYETKNMDLSHGSALAMLFVDGPP